VQTYQNEDMNLQGKIMQYKLFSSFYVGSGLLRNAGERSGEIRNRASVFVG
jgi:hypothetical protein